LEEREDEEDNIKAKLNGVYYEDLNGDDPVQDHGQLSV
jgi:hypothetical protein